MHSIQMSSGLLCECYVLSKTVCLLEVNCYHYSNMLIDQLLLYFDQII